MKRKSFLLDVKSVEDEGTFSGYGSVFGVIDSYREIVAPGAFAESLAEAKAKNRNFPVLWQHRTGEPIGAWLNLAEDGVGLYGEGKLWIDEAANARVAHRGMKDRAITGLSIGYFVREDSFDEKTRIRTLKRVDLIEISIVTMPANDEARVDSVKTASEVLREVLVGGDLPDLPVLEKLLREAGFSKSQAKVVAAHGLPELLRREAGSEPAAEQRAIAEALRELRAAISR